jgi:two-component system chemotaxis sensor kinase CheA
MDDLLADFLTETQEGLGALDAALLRLERAPDDVATLSEVFRIVHTIKGTCGFLGLTRMEGVAHAAENVLGRYRDGTLRATQSGISAILGAIDCIRAIVAALEGTGAEPAGDDSQLIASLDAVASGEAAPVAAGPAPEPPPSASSAVAAAPSPPAAAEPEAGGANAPPQTIRVAVDVLEGLMMLVSRAGPDPQPAPPAVPQRRRQCLRRAATAPVPHHL